MEGGQLDSLDIFTYLVVGPISALFSLVLFVVHLFSPELRAQPGDLVMMIAFSELLLCAHWISSAIHTSSITTDYREDSAFCQINSVIAVGSAALEITYNLCFLTYIFFKIKTAIRPGYMPRKTYHIFCWIVTLFVLFSSRNKMYKKNPYGTCSIKMSEKDIYVGAALILGSLSIAAFVFIYTRNNLPTVGAKASEVRREFMSYYKRYIKTLIIMWSLIFLTFCFQLLSTKGYKWEVQLFNMGRLGNTVKVLMPLMLVLLRTEDPHIRKYIDKHFLQIIDKTGSLSFLKRSDSTVDKEKESLLINGSSSFIQEEQRPNSNSIAADKELEMEMYMDSNDQNWFNAMSCSRKETFVRTVLASIQTYYPQVLEEMDGEPLVPNDSSGLAKIVVEGKELIKNLRTDKDIFDCEMSIYAPNLFRHILMQLTEPLDFSASLDIDANAEAIKCAGESGGGASGELFVFSADRRLIVKTMTLEEYYVFLQLIFDYGEHFVQHPHSLIGKIFGLFDFNLQGSDKSIKLIVMENIFRVPKQAILRMYDMKGSTHSRKVLKSYEGWNSKTREKRVLKDLDFLQTETKIPVKETSLVNAQSLMKRIETDVELFRSHKIIDYSIVVAVVEKAACPPEVIQRELSDNQAHVIESDSDSELFYYVGIIDYFQLYTFKKSAERFLKRTQACSPSLETSSQPPSHYARRFVLFMKNIFSK